MIKKNELNYKKILECYKKVPDKNVFLSNIGYERGNFLKILNKKKNITVSTLIKIINEFDKPITYFFDEDNVIDTISMEKISGLEQENHELKRELDIYQRSEQDKIEKIEIQKETINALKDKIIIMDNLISQVKKTYPNIDFGSTGTRITSQ